VFGVSIGTVVVAELVPVCSAGGRAADMAASMAMAVRSCNALLLARRDADPKPVSCFASTGLLACEDGVGGPLPFASGAILLVNNGLELLMTGLVLVGAVVCVELLLAAAALAAKALLSRAAVFT